MSSKRLFSVFAAVAVLACFSGAANAQQDFPRDITLSWVNASQYTDGSTIEAGDLTGVRIECFRQNETVPIVVGNFVPTSEGAAQSETLAAAIPNPGTYTCFGYSVVIGGIESDASSPAQKKYVGKPNAPAAWKVFN